jgi:hypothetical protein
MYKIVLCKAQNFVCNKSIWSKNSYFYADFKIFLGAFFHLGTYVKIFEISVKFQIF